MTTIKCGGREVCRTVLSEKDIPLNLADFTEFAVEKLREELKHPMFESLDERYIESFLKANRKRISETVEEILSNPSKNKGIVGMAFPSIIRISEDPVELHIHCKCDTFKVYAVYIGAYPEDFMRFEEKEETNND